MLREKIRQTSYQNWHRSGFFAEICLSKRERHKLIEWPQIFKELSLFKYCNYWVVLLEFTALDCFLCFDKTIFGLITWGYWASFCGRFFWLTLTSQVYSVAADTVTADRSSFFCGWELRPRGCYSWYANKGQGYYSWGKGGKTSKVNWITP